MKSKTTLALLMYAIALTSCKNETQKTSKTPQTQEVVEDTLTLQENELPRFFKSAIRPNEKLHLKKHYSDTVTFIEFNNYDYDEVLFGIKTKTDTVHLISEDLWEDKFLPETPLVISWKIDSLRPAGDPENIVFTEFLVTTHTIKPSLPIPKKITVLWRENRYDEQLKTEVSTLVFNQPYVQTLSPQEKAALGYVTTFIGNECEWDGLPNEDRSNLNCQFLSALNLGYQCSEKHLGFLNHWFAGDSIALRKLKTCPTIPNTATVQSMLNEITIEVHDNDHRIQVHYSYLNINTREGKAQEVMKTSHFKFDCEGIALIDTE